MAKTTSSNKCTIEANSKGSLSCGYTKVRVLPENYNKIITITGLTGKTIQDVVDELLDFAIRKTEIKINGKKVIDFSEDKK